MKMSADSIKLSASDLVGNLNCGGLTALDLKVAVGELKKTVQWDPLLEILRERGFHHEEAFVNHMTASGLQSVRIAGVDISESAALETISAMEDGVQVIIQGTFRSQRWTGRTDILRRVETPSRFGSWSYEVIDTKPARETKGGTVLQLCLYSHLLTQVQETEPEFTYVVAPWSDFEPQCFRVSDYGAYFRKAKLAVERATEGGSLHQAPYPDPKLHCNICRWYEACDKRRRSDDHLSFVAGISMNQISELQDQGVTTLEALAHLPLPWKPKRGAVQSFERVREQARLQLTARESGEHDAVFRTGLAKQRHWRHLSHPRWS